MANALFGYGNLIDLPSTVLSCGSQRSNLPASSLADPDLQIPWVTAGTTTDWVHADFGSVQSFRMLGLFGALLTSTALVRWRIGNSTLIDEAAALDLDFTTGVLDPRITFTRASVGTYYDALGVLRTAAAGVPRASYRYDTATGKWIAAGLLTEESRTNCIAASSALHTVFNSIGSSNATWTAAAAVAQDGTITAAKLGATAANTAVAAVAYPAVGTAGATVTASVYVQAAGANKVSLQPWGTSAEGGGYGPVVTFALATGTIAAGAIAGRTAITPQGNGVYRCSLSWTLQPGSSSANVAISLAAADVPSVGAGVYLWGGQVEIGAFPTSLIPTSGAPVTRAADTVTLSLSSVAGLSPAQGTVVVDAAYPVAQIVGYPGLAKLDDGTSANSVAVYYDATYSRHRGVATVGGVAAFDSFTLSSVAAISGQPFRLGLAYAAADFAFSVDGSAPVVGASGAVPSGLTTLRIGDANGFISRLRLYPKRLSNAQLQALTGADNTTIIADVLDTGWVPAAVAEGYWSTLKLLDSAVSGRCVRADINDPARSTTIINGQDAGDLIIGRLAVMPVIQPLRCGVRRSRPEIPQAELRL